MCVLFVMCVFVCGGSIARWCNGDMHDYTVYCTCAYARLCECVGERACVCVCVCVLVCKKIVCLSVIFWAYFLVFAVYVCA